MKRLTPSGLFKEITNRIGLDKSRYYALSGGDYQSIDWVVNAQVIVSIVIREDDDPRLSVSVVADMPSANIRDTFPCGTIIGYEEDLDYILEIARLIIPTARDILWEDA